MVNSGHGPEPAASLSGSSPKRARPSETWERNVGHTANANYQAEFPHSRRSNNQCRKYQFITALSPGFKMLSCSEELLQQTFSKWEKAKHYTRYCSIRSIQSLGSFADFAAEIIISR